MKLYSYEDFKKHPRFNLKTGLCENTASIYGLYYSSEDNILLTYYLYVRKLRLTHPIGINGYNKRLKNGSSTNFNARTFRGKNIYNHNMDNNTLYVGMQDALRHNLYHNYCLWFKANNPDVIYPAPIDFL